MFCFLLSLLLFPTRKNFVVYDLNTKNCVLCDPGMSLFIFTEGEVSTEA